MDIASLQLQFESDLDRAAGDVELRAVRDKYLSRKNGLIQAFLKTVATAPPDVRPALGSV